eukprot:COSAG02_NODE_225_length_28184_cov_16.570981_8_plen_141_part_00
MDQVIVRLVCRDVPRSFKVACKEVATDGILLARAGWLVGVRVAQRVPVSIGILPQERILPAEHSQRSRAQGVGADTSTHRGRVQPTSHEPGTPIRVEGSMLKVLTTVRHGPSRASAAWMLQVHRTTMVPFFITHGDGLLQ